MPKRKSQPMQLVTIRLDTGMRDALKQAAKVEGLPYQTLTRRILREWLKAWFERHLDELR